MDPSHWPARLICYCLTLSAPGLTLSVAKLVKAKKGISTLSTPGLTRIRVAAPPAPRPPSRPPSHRPHTTTVPAPRPRTRRRRCTSPARTRPAPQPSRALPGPFQPGRTGRPIRAGGPRPDTGRRRGPQTPQQRAPPPAPRRPTAARLQARTAASSSQVTAELVKPLLSCQCPRSGP